ncbi:MAG TPA: hypothetical protein VGM92_07015 [Candidatus Kapabacteria bacterium]
MSLTEPKTKSEEELLSLCDFAEQTLHINVWPKIKELLNAVAPEDGTPGSRKILVRSCNGAGKTTALAAICNWYFLQHPDSIVLTTASSWNQVKRNLWGEIRRQAREAHLFQKPIAMFETKIKLDEKHFMIGISPDIPENAMGFHAPHLLIAVDEATGVTREIMTALMGNLTGSKAQIVLICNPIDTDSYAYEAEQSGEWTVITISAFDHPNLKEKMEIIPGAVDESWVLDRLKEWSVELGHEGMEVGKAIYVECADRWYRLTSLIQSRLLGEWSSTDSLGFIPMELIERYSAEPKQLQFVEEPHWPTAGIRALGVDIARGNAEDATVYAYFDVMQEGPDIQLKFQQYYEEDLMATADRIEREYHRCAANGIELVIAVDDTGLGGGVTDALKRKNIPLFAVNFGAAPKGFLREKHLANARAEMYFLLADEIREGKVEFIHHKRFHQELAAVQLDVSKTNGAFKMEDKAIAKKRLGRSPDFADATALARYGLKLKEIAKRDKLIL